MIHFLNATGRLTEYEDEISAIVETVIKQHETIHELESFDVVVAENNMLLINTDNSRKTMRVKS